MIKSRLPLVLPLLCLVVALGCYKNPAAPATLAGKITYKGAPVTAGMVTFFPKNGGVYTAVIDPNGSYAVSEIPTGEMVVTIETESANPNRKVPTYGGKAGGEGMSPVPQGQGSGTAGGAYVKIPAKYADKDKSGLTVTVTPGKQTKDFELTD